MIVSRRRHLLRALLGTLVPTTEHRGQVARSRATWPPLDRLRSWRQLLSSQRRRAHCRVPDLVEVVLFGLDVAEQQLDSGLVGGSAGTAEVLVDGARGHELPG